MLARRPIAMAVIFLVLGALGLLAPIASAETYVVDNNGDASGGACVTATPADCSLRSAITLSNASTGTTDTIEFDEAIFNGQLPGSRITLGSALPSITDRALINGRYSCAAGGFTAPCVEVAASSPAVSVLTIDNADNSSINGLALTGGRNGINVINSTQAVTITGSWIGVKLDLSAGGNSEAGVFLDPDSDGALIGGPNPSERNVISNNATGVDVLGADQATIRGNFIGVGPDGSTLAGNMNKGVEVTDSIAGGGFTAEGTDIGNQVFPSGAVSAACDEGCNVIAGGNWGVDLNGDGGGQEEAPATGPTVVHSNYVGINATGTGPVVGQMQFGIMVGAAGDVVVGGPAVSGIVNANRIAEAAYGVYAENAENLLVQLNTVGANFSGQGIGFPTQVGMFVFSLGVTEPAVLQSNAITGAAVGIEQRFTGSEILGNSIRKTDRGILTKASGGEGSLIESNTIEESASSAILIEDDGNEVLGNTVRTGSGSGIRIQTPGDQGLLPSTGNLIGGPGGDENSIEQIDGSAIEISNLEDSDNEISANNGRENEDFIALISANPGTEPNGPNHGIKPPAISTATPSSIAGTALADAKVLVFLKEEEAPGEIKSFLGEATANGSGAWSLPVSVADGTRVAALQTSTSGGSSELAFATAKTPEAGGGNGGGGGGAGGGGSGSADKAPPQTKITKGPKGKSRSRTAKFKFTSSEPGSTFQCKLDRKPFKSCRSPRKYKGLKPGKHVFRVRAIDAAGNVDPSPAKRSFRVTG